jgi:hypothetical protein
VNCRHCSKPRPPVGGVPYYADPRAAMSREEFRFTPTFLTGFIEVIIAPANPARIAIGFALNDTAPMSIYVLPAPGAREFGWPLDYFTGFPRRWFDLLTYGSMVSYEWRAYSNGDQTIGMMERLVSQGG